MKTFARFLVIGTMLLARCAWATELTPVAFAKSAISERGSETFATVSYPDKTLIVEFRLDPYSTGKATAVRAFGEITKNCTRRVQQIPKDQERPAHWQPRAAR